MKKIALLIILTNLFYSCNFNNQKQKITYPKAYVIEIEFNDHTIDTVFYESKNKSKASIKFISSIPGFLGDRPIETVLGASYFNGRIIETIATDVRKYKLIKEIY